MNKPYEQFKIDQEHGQLNGCYLDVPNEEYHASKGISKSGLDLINRSPAHFKYAPSFKTTQAMRMGTAIHTAVLEPARFEAEYMLLDNVTDKRKSEYKEAVKQFGYENVLTTTEADKVKGMQEAINANADAFSLLDMTGNAEVSIYAIEPETGVQVKCRFDYLRTDDIAVDLKKTQDARADKFSKSIADYRYHVQAAFYSDVYLWATGRTLQAFYFLAVEEEAPNYCKPWLLSDESLEIGQYEYKKDLTVYNCAMLEDYWPMPNGDIEEINLPNWKISQYEETIEGEIK